MLKHVEQSVAIYALRWFQQYEAGLAAMYAPHCEVDLQFRGRLDLLRKRAHDFEREVAFRDPDRWDAETVLGAFTASLMLKDALDAAGPLLLRRTHEVLARAGKLPPPPQPRASTDTRTVAAAPRKKRAAKNSRLPAWMGAERHRRKKRSK